MHFLKLNSYEEYYVEIWNLYYLQIQFYYGSIWILNHGFEGFLYLPENVINIIQNVINVIRFNGMKLIFCFYNQQIKMLFFKSGKNIKKINNLLLNNLSWEAEHTSHSYIFQA